MTLPANPTLPDTDYLRGREDGYAEGLADWRIQALDWIHLQQEEDCTINLNELICRLVHEIDLETEEKLR